MMGSLQYIKESSWFGESSDWKKDIVGSSPLIVECLHSVEKIAPLPNPVLIQGETGTGKELFAKAIYERSMRADKQFVAVNCGALCHELFMSELFGHQKGAFTGANENRNGAFIEADGGTIFLDEVAEIPLHLQAALLRVLEYGEVKPIGSSKTSKVDVRIIASTNRNLKDLVVRDLFRKDLYFRLSSLGITLPPLRRRKSDIPDLVMAILSESGRDARITPAAMDMLIEYDWPGNIRELRNVLASSLASTSYSFGLYTISRENLALPRREQMLQPDDPTEQVMMDMFSSSPVPIRNIENIAILGALKYHNGNKQKAAETLGIAKSTLYDRLRTLDKF